MTSQLFTIRLRLPADQKEEDLTVISSALQDRTISASAIREGHQDTGDWILEWLSEGKPDSVDLVKTISDFHSWTGREKPHFISAEDFVIEILPDKDWLQECYNTFKPFTVGEFFIYGSHHEGPKMDDKINLQIDAASAFGSGEHGTTKGCLQAMLALKEEGVCPWNILDMGCGSGILSIAAWKLWKTPILAVDIEQRAAEVSEHHQKLNNVPLSPTDMMALQGDGFQTSAVQRRAPYDLIIANILASPLIEMAEDMKQVCNQNGLIILSGMKTSQTDKVLKTYEGQGFQLQKREDIDDWSTLVLMN